MPLNNSHLTRQSTFMTMVKWSVFSLSVVKAYFWSVVKQHTHTHKLMLLCNGPHVFVPYSTLTLLIYDMDTRLLKYQEEN